MNDISQFDIRTSVTNSVIEVFNTMISIQMEPSETNPQSDFGDDRIVGSVNMAGGITGIFNIQVSKEFAKIITASMLEIEVSKTDDYEQIKDVISEVSNIIGGNLKSVFTDAGIPCELSPPSITTGSDFRIESLSTERYEHFCFTYQSHTLFVEVGIKMQADYDRTSNASKAKKRIAGVEAERLETVDIGTAIQNSIIEVFDMMVSLEVELTDKVPQASQEGLRTVGSVSFAGDVMGIINIQVSGEFARIMAASMLEMEVDELEGEEGIKDVIGEIGNIVGGGVKSVYTDIGLSCVLSTPSITTGNDFKIESLNMTNYKRFAFQHKEHIIFVEAGIRMPESLQIITQPESEIYYEVMEEGSQETLYLEADKKIGSISLLKNYSSENKATDNTAHEGPSHDLQNNTANDSGSNKPFGNIDFILDIPVEIHVELGRTKTEINELLNLGQGSIVELSQLEGEPVNIMANQTLIGRGEVMVEDKKYAVRITQLTRRGERIYSLRT